MSSRGVRFDISGMSRGQQRGISSVMLYEVNRVSWSQHGGVRYVVVTRLVAWYEITHVLWSQQRGAYEVSGYVWLSCGMKLILCSDFKGCKVSRVSWGQQRNVRSGVWYEISRVSWGQINGVKIFLWYEVICVSWGQPRGARSSRRNSYSSAILTLVKMTYKLRL